MSTQTNRRGAGFTLLEIIVSLTLMALVVGVLFNALGYGVSAFVFTEQRVEDAQQTRLALSRMRRELMEMSAVSTASTQDSLTYTSSGGAQAVLALASGTLTYNGHTLMNGLGAYSASEHLFTYSKSDGSAWAPASDVFNDLFKITILLRVSSGGQTINYTTTVNPRKTDVPDGPIMQIDE